MNGQREDVRFENGSRASLIQGGAGDDAGGLIDAAGLGGRTGRPVLLVCGGADDLRGPQWELADSLLGPAIASAAALTGATVVASPRPKTATAGSTERRSVSPGSIRAMRSIPVSMVAAMEGALLKLTEAPW